VTLGKDRSRRARGFVPALLCAVVLAVLAAVQLTTRASAGDSERCERFTTASTERAGLVTGSGTPTLVVGDSWSVGLGLADASGSWPTRLPGTVRVAGFSGSGFSLDASECGDVSFAARAAAALTPETELVVVEGGLNDFDRSDTAIRQGFARLVTALDRAGADPRVVVVGPAAAPSRAEAVRRVDALLRELTGAAGWTYVAAYDWELGYLSDRLHLTPEGHVAFGDLVAEAVGATS
jgi:acyl-CoA thioesterase-1